MLRSGSATVGAIALDQSRHWFPMSGYRGQDLITLVVGHKLSSRLVRHWQRLGPARHWLVRAWQRSTLT